MIDKPVRLSHDDYDRYVAARQERDALAARLAEAEKWRDINQEIVEKLKVALRRPGTECSYVEWAAECRSAVDRLAEAERDAARYRWLVGGDNPSISGRFNSVYRAWDGEDGADGFTAVLDAARAADSADDARERQ